MLKPFGDARSIYHVVEPALRAPSVYNTQPWSFRIIADDRIELRANVGDGGDGDGSGSGWGDGTCCCMLPLPGRGPANTRSAAGPP